MTTLRQAAQQALEALRDPWSSGPEGVAKAIKALHAALAEPQDPVAYDGWVLREVLFDNGEPVGHRAPEQEPVAWMEMVVANLVREGVNKHKARQLAHHFAALVAAAERKVIMDSLQKQADMATDALDRRWALEMITAVAARSSK